MFNWFRKKETLEFADNQAAFRHACSIGYTPLIGGLVPALVEQEGGTGRDGERTFLVSLAGPHGAMKVWTCTLKESATHPDEGDLVGFRIVTIASDLPEPANLVGFIACKLHPVLVPGKGWAVAQSYTPKNIKRPIRFF